MDEESNVGVKVFNVDGCKDDWSDGLNVDEVTLKLDGLTNESFNVGVVVFKLDGKNDCRSKKVGVAVFKIVGWREERLNDGADVSTSIGATKVGCDEDDKGDGWELDFNVGSELGANDGFIVDRTDGK